MPFTPCDRCCARAAHAWQNGPLLLTLCRHHSREAERSLLAGAWSCTVLDHPAVATA